MDTLLFAIRAFAAIFVIFDPVGNAPIFLAITAGRTDIECKRIAKRSVIFATLVLLVFAAAGQAIMHFFGFTIPALQIAGGVLLFVIALQMLQARVSPQRITQRDQDAAIEQDDVALVPLAVPLMSGPGSITATMILMAQAETPARIAAVLISIALTAAIAYVLFTVAPAVTRRLRVTGIGVLTRLMGLILAIIAVQFVIDGVKDAFVK